MDCSTHFSGRRYKKEEGKPRSQSWRKMVRTGELNIKVVAFLFGGQENRFSKWRTRIGRPSDPQNNHLNLGQVSARNKIEYYLFWVSCFVVVEEQASPAWQDILSKPARPETFQSDCQVMPPPSTNNYNFQIHSLTFWST